MNRLIYLLKNHIKKESKLNYKIMAIQNFKIEITKYIENETCFDFDGIEDDIIYFSTRENGNVHEEEFSPIDYREAIRIKNYVNQNWGGLSVTIDTFDEWVNIEISKS